VNTGILEEHAASIFRVYFIDPIDLCPAVIVATCLCNLTIITALTSALKVEAAYVLQDVAFYLQCYRVSQLRRPQSELFIFVSV
jgi:hypothetical protein